MSDYELSQLSGRVHGIERKLDALASVVDNLRYDVQRIDDLKRELDYLDRRLDALRSDVNDIASG